MPSTAADRELIRLIRQGDEGAWERCIAEYEGRLQAFVFSRLGDRGTAEDLVQETFLGFLTALPNYDEQTPLESFLFAIAAHKITDALRRMGRRPMLPLRPVESSESTNEPPARERVASSIARSRERREGEEELVAHCLKSLIDEWMADHEFERLKCAELLFVSGIANKDAAAALAISEQAVANHKYFIVNKLKEAVRRRARTEVDFEQLGLTE